jgi:hypothetical protein
MNLINKLFNIIKKLHKFFKSPIIMDPENYRIVFNESNETEKALIAKKYISKFNQDNKLLVTIFRMASNEAISNNIFSDKFVEIKGHEIMFEFATTPQLKWLSYSTLWNLFRTINVRENIKKSFLNKIINDYSNIIKMEEKIVHVYFGALSNICLKDEFRKDLSKFLCNINILPPLTEPILTSINGVLANLAVPDYNIPYLLKSNFVNNLFIKFEYKENDILIRNTLAFLNNCATSTTLNQFKEFYIKNLLTEKLEKYSDIINNNFLTTLYLTITNLLNYIPGDTSLHLAIKNDIYDLAYEFINSKKFDINSINSQRNTPLHYALKPEKHKSIAKFLIYNNADYLEYNDNNERAIDIDKELINNCINNKRNLDNKYFEEIKKEFDNSIKTKYEINLCGIINEYVDKTDDLAMMSIV